MHYFMSYAEQINDMYFDETDETPSFCTYSQLTIKLDI